MQQYINISVYFLAFQMVVIKFSQAYADRVIMILKYVSTYLSSNMVLKLIIFCLFETAALCHDQATVKSAVPCPKLHAGHLRNARCDSVNSAHAHYRNVRIQYFSGKYPCTRFPRVCRPNGVTYHWCVESGLALGTQGPRSRLAVLAVRSPAQGLY